MITALHVPLLNVRLFAQNTENFSFEMTSFVLDLKIYCVIWSSNWWKALYIYLIWLLSIIICFLKQLERPHIFLQRGCDKICGNLLWRPRKHFCCKKYVETGKFCQMTKYFQLQFLRCSYNIPITRLNKLWRESQSALKILNKNYNSQTALSLIIKNAAREQYNIHAK